MGGGLRLSLAILHRRAEKSQPTALLSECPPKWIMARTPNGREGDPVISLPPLLLTIHLSRSRIIRAVDEGDRRTSTQALRRGDFGLQPHRARARVPRSTPNGNVQYPRFQMCDTGQDYCRWGKIPATILLVTWRVIDNPGISSPTPTSISRNLPTHNFVLWCNGPEREQLTA